MITKLAISGYRSLRDVKLHLEGVNIVTGANDGGTSIKVTIPLANPHTFP